MASQKRAALSQIALGATPSGDDDVCGGDVAIPRGGRASAATAETTIALRASAAATASHAPPAPSASRASRSCAASAWRASSEETPSCSVFLRAVWPPRRAAALSSAASPL